MTLAEGRTAAVLDTMMMEPPAPAAIRAPTRAVRRNGSRLFRGRRLLQAALIEHARDIGLDATSARDGSRGTSA